METSEVMKGEIERFVNVAQAVTKAVEAAKNAGVSFDHLTKAMNTMASGIAKKQFLDQVENDYLV